MYTKIYRREPVEHASDTIYVITREVKYNKE